MLNRRLVKAAALSLGFHAALLTAVGFTIGKGPEPPPSQPRHSATLVRLTTASKHLPAIAESASESEVIPEIVPAPAATPVPESPAAAGSINGDEGNADNKGLVEKHSISPNSHPGSSGLHESTDPSLITSIEPVYPVLARRMGVEGVVHIVVTVDPGGVPIECTIIPPRVHKVLEESALAAVMQARFQPGMEGGRPIQDTYRLKVRFELEA